MTVLDHDLLTNRRTDRIFSQLQHTKRIVDVGCGIRPCPAFKCDEYICIEPHDEYVEQLRAWEPGFPVRIVQAEWQAVAGEPRKNTTVLMLDVIEHLERDVGETARALLQEFEHAVIFTPLGWYKQGDENPDPWGYNGGFWQKHRSAWQPEDFPGWHVRVWPKWHSCNGVGAILAMR